MIIDLIIDNAIAAETLRQEANAEIERAAETHARQTEHLHEVFRDSVIPALEEARQKLTAKGIECSLTNGRDPGTRKLRHGLTLTWREGLQSLTFTAVGDDVIKDTVVIGGRAFGSIRRRPFNSTPQDAIAIVASFLSRALNWIPRS